MRYSEPSQDAGYVAKARYLRSTERFLLYLAILNTLSGC